MDIFTAIVIASVSLAIGAGAVLLAIDSLKAKCLSDLNIRLSKLEEQQSRESSDLNARITIFECNFPVNHQVIEERFKTEVRLNQATVDQLRSESSSAYQAIAQRIIEQLSAEREVTKRAIGDAKRELKDHVDTLLLQVSNDMAGRVMPDLTKQLNGTINAYNARIASLEKEQKLHAEEINRLNKGRKTKKNPTEPA